MSLLLSVAFSLFAGLMMTRVFKKLGLGLPDVTSFLIAGVISVAVIILKRNKQRYIHFAVPILMSVLFVAGGVL